MVPVMNMKYSNQPNSRPSHVCNLAMDLRNWSFMTVSGSCAHVASRYDSAHATRPASSAGHAMPAQAAHALRAASAHIAAPL